MYQIAELPFKLYIAVVREGTSQHGVQSC